MTDNKKDDPGKGPLWSSDRRPHATIDVQATEVGREDKGKAAGSAKPAGEQPVLPPPGSAKGDSARPSLAQRLAAARAWPGKAAGNNSFLSHVAAGVAGAVLTLIAAALLGLFSGDAGSQDPAASDMTKRMAALEQAVRQRPPAQGGDVTGRLAAAEAKLKGLEEQTRALGGLGDAQAKLATEIKALQGRGTSPELAERLSKIETALAAASAGDPSARGPQAAALAAKLADLEKIASDALEAAKAAGTRGDRDLAVLKTDASRLAQRIDAFKADIDERLRNAAKSGDLASLQTRIAAFEQEVQGLLKGEGERKDNTQRVLLALEIANLKRAMDRGDRYSAELDAVRKVAGSTLNLAPLERYSLEGVPTLPALTKDFRRVANAAMDAQAEQPDASVWERLVAGARSLVRVRKTGHSADDMSAEAVLGRMEAALKDGRLGEVLAQAGKLPPKASAAAADWLGRVQARYAVDQSLAEIDAALKSSLAARTEPGTGLKR
jgi:hypothetical protein